MVCVLLAANSELFFTARPWNCSLYFFLPTRGFFLTFVVDERHQRCRFVSAPFSCLYIQRLRRVSIHCNTPRCLSYVIYRARSLAPCHGNGGPSSTDSATFLATHGVHVFFLLQFPRTRSAVSSLHSACVLARMQVSSRTSRDLECRIGVVKTPVARRHRICVLRLTNCMQCCR